MKALEEICDVEGVFHIAREHNISDMATHPGVKASEIGPESIWQKGPNFLVSPRESWPITKEKTECDVPEIELRSKRMNVFASTTVPQGLSSSLQDIIKNSLNYSDSFVKVQSILARIIRGSILEKNHDFVNEREFVKEQVSEPLTPDLLNAAERLMLFYAMPETQTAFDEGKLDSLLAKTEKSLIVTTGRLGENSLSRLLGKSALPILMPTTRVAYLYMLKAHCGDSDMVHKSATDTLANSRHHVWIVRGKQLAKKIVRNCVMCIKLRKETVAQQMAEIKPESLQMCKPWTFVSLDFAGPISCKGVVNARARKKCWILVYVCRNTKAVCLLATAGYDTASFLLRHEEFVARKGAPLEIVSDQGSQLVAASGIISKKEESPNNWDWRKVADKNSNTRWKLVPAASQHYNGLPESMVKALKKSLTQTLHPGVVSTYDELVTLLARISTSINSRPLGLSSTSGSDQQEDNFVPITPNHMLLGRATPETPPMEYSESDKFCQRVAFVAALEKDWWDRWVKTVLPTLFPARKWKKEESNLCVGDIVLVIFPGKIKDYSSLAMVTKVHPDQKGLVRKVDVKYRRKVSTESPFECNSKGKMEEKEVAVQRLVLVIPASNSESASE